MHSLSGSLDIPGVYQLIWSQKKLLLFIFIYVFFFVKIYWFKLFYYSALGWHLAIDLFQDSRCDFSWTMRDTCEIGKFILLCCVNTDLHSLAYAPIYVSCRCMPTLMATLNSGEKIIFERTLNVWPIESASVFCESEWMGIHLRVERFALVHLTRSCRL